MPQSPAAKKAAPAKGKKKPATRKKAAGSAAIGRPSSYTPELGALICQHIADAVSIRAIAAMDGMPCASTIMLWLDGRQPAFSEQYARAREAQADKLADEILSIADEEVTMVKRSKHSPKAEADDEEEVEVVFDPTAVARNKLRVDARKWLASKMAPKKYGDKIEATHTGPNGAPIQHRVAIEFVEPGAAEGKS